MYHGIHFAVIPRVGYGDTEEFDTYENWHLIPTTRPVINPPGVKTNFVDVPGADGHLDLTDLLTGYPFYESRTGSIEFAVEPNSGEYWSGIYANIMRAIHGRKGKMTLDDDLAFYYEGRFSISSWKSDKNYSIVTVDYDVDSYKLELWSSIEDWLWDPFDFEQSIIQEGCKDVRIDVADGAAPKVIEILGMDRPVVPRITCKIDAGKTMKVQAPSYNKQVTLKNGENNSPYIVLHGEVVQLKFWGYGTVTVEFRRGVL